jgi:hypothetical protein
MLSSIAVMLEAGFPARLVIPVAPPGALGIRSEGAGKVPAAPTGEPGYWSYVNEWGHGVSASMQTMADEAGANAGLILGQPEGGMQLACLDLDMAAGDSLDDPETKHAITIRDRIVKTVAKSLGAPIWVRTTRPGRGAMLFRIDPGQIAGRKAVVHLSHPVLGDLGKIELLSQGQQIVVAGVHPFTMRPITWARSDAPTEHFPVPQLDDAMPLLPTRTALNDLLNFILSDLAKTGIVGTVPRTTGLVENDLSPSARAEDQAPPSAEIVLHALAQLRHDGTVDRDDYVAVMHAAASCARALRARDAATDEELVEIREAAIMWGARWEDPKGQGTTVQTEMEKWDTDWSQRPDIGAGWHTLRAIAERHGVTGLAEMEAQQSFEPTEEIPVGGEKPRIEFKVGHLADVVTKAEDALLTSGLQIYQRGGDLVRPGVREVRTAGGRTTSTTVFEVLGADAVIDLLSQSADWMKYDGRTKAMKVINPPSQVSDILLSRRGQWRFPAIMGLISAPTLRPDGSVLSAPGFDQETGLYNTARDIVLSSIVGAPNKADAYQALDRLNALLDEFPFASEGKLSVDRAVVLSAMLSSVCRGAIKSTPLHAFKANAPGSGKTYLAEIVAAILMGGLCPANSVPELIEFDKQLTGMLLEGHPLFSLDNCNGPIGSDLLCQALTTPSVRLRPLGRSDMKVVSVQSTILANGNGLTLVGDMVRRGLIGNLDPKMERPDLRVFKNQPVDIVLGNRSAYVSACLIIVRAYITAGRPGCLSPRLASFGDWSDNVRSALVWLGCEDPVLSMDQVRADDPVLGEMRQVIASWPAEMRDEIGATTAQMIATANATQPIADSSGNSIYTHSEWRQALVQVAGKAGAVDPNRLGVWLRSNAGRVVGKQRIVKSAHLASGGTARWLIETIKEGG